ncbi:MAG: peptidoglycan-binding domain-containing protein [Desulfobacterales bacterium]|nr:peptidoglycan-binding domain-containing protein [Desulfobacterales bacterium]
MKQYLKLIAVFVMLAIADPGFAYPLDAYSETGIRRIEAARLAVFGKMRGRQQPPGALLPTHLVDLRLLDYPNLVLPEPDPEFTDGVVKLLGDKADRYGVAVLDLSDIDNPRYAEHRADYKQNVGSVGKIVAALALFQALADIYPDDNASRIKLLRETIITADEFIEWDHHEVRIWNPDTGALSFRPLQKGDQGSLWEYLDWTLSISSNAAAAMVMKNAMLLRHFQKNYPVTGDEATRIFKKMSREQLRELYEQTFFEPLTRNGLDLQYFRQGSFFTRTGKQSVPTGYNSYATARELMRFILLMEQGKLVDVFSSREIKRLLYMTERRIRYASSPALNDSAVYFKSGSLYSCKKEPGFKCKKYHGNVKNYMNSVAIVETPAGLTRLHYLATLISNVLYKNSAVDHQTLATYIHRLIETNHPPKMPAPGELPAEVTFTRNLIGFEDKQKERQQIAEVQAALLKLGYNVGKVDGKLGSKTNAAIRAFQKEHQLGVDGKITPQLLDELKTTDETKPAADLSQPVPATEQ